MFKAVVKINGKEYTLYGFAKRLMKKLGTFVDSSQKNYEVHWIVRLSPCWHNFKKCLRGDVEGR